MGALIRYIATEPVATVALVQSVITLFVVFGVSITDAQTGAILTFTTLVLGFIARALVTPTAKLD